MKNTEIKKDWGEEFYLKFGAGIYDDNGKFIAEDIKQFIQQKIKEERTRALDRGYMDCLSDCVELTDCEECKEHLQMFKLELKNPK